MESRPFRFHLSADAKLPAQDYVYRAASLWILAEETASKILLAPPQAHELPLCQALHARVRKAVTNWSGLQGRHEVVLTSHGSYLLSLAAQGLHVGNHVDCSPGTWICRLIALNGQEAVVSGFRGDYLDGAPWEEATVLLGEVRRQVDDLLTARKPDWTRVAARCERLLQAGFVEDAEVQQFLYSLWGQVGFREPWSATLQKHRRMPPGP